MTTHAASALESWYRDELGFVRGNPFQHNEARQEGDLLPEFFVEIEGYDRVKAARSVIVFAPRGGGKSALQLMLAAQMAARLPQARLLAVEINDFEPLIKNPSTNAHVSLCLKQGLLALFTALGGLAEDDSHWQFSLTAHQAYGLRAAALDLPARRQLARWLHNFLPELLVPDHIFKMLQSFDPSFRAAPSHYHLIYSERPSAIPGFLGSPAKGVGRIRAIAQGFPTLQADPVVALLDDLLESGPSEGVNAASNQEILQKFIGLVRSCGFSRVEFLYDRLDEISQTKDDPQVQADILSPLLGDLRLLELPGAAFKFFITREVRDLMARQKTYRRDRLADQAVTVQWSQAMLERLLVQRLETYSTPLPDPDNPGDDTRTPGVTDLNQLCDPADAAAPRILDEMLHLAYGSPRRLLIAANELLRAHLDRIGPSGLLSWADWERAQKGLFAAYQGVEPVLRILRQERRAFIEETELKLSPQAFEIIHALASAGGELEREELCHRVWGVDGCSGVSDEAIQAAVRRTREALGDSADNPIFLYSLPGKIYRLAYFELE